MVANLVADGQTDNRDNFQALIESTVGYSHTTINIPTGDYSFGVGNWRNFMRSNITINCADGTTLSDAPFIYVSRTTDSIEGPSNVTWNNCHFTDSTHHVFVHASNITFNDCVWDNVQRSNGHVMDITGSHNILVNHNTFIGYADDFDDDSALLYKEAVQVDYAYDGSIGSIDEVLAKAGTSNAVYDNAPSYNITIQNSQFLPSYNPDGTIARYSTPPMGAHVNICENNISDCIHDIKFINNYVLDSLDVGSPPINSYNDGISHWRTMSGLEISGNIFRSTTSMTNDYTIRLHASANTPGIHNVLINDNKFVDIEPREGYIYMRAADSSMPIGTISNVEICRNKVYLSKPDNHKPFLTQSGQGISDVRSDCDNQFLSLSEFDMCLIDGTLCGDNANKNEAADKADKTPSAPNTGLGLLLKSPLLVAISGLITASIIFLITRHQTARRR